MKAVGGYFKHCDERSLAAARTCLKRCGIRGTTAIRAFASGVTLGAADCQQPEVSSILEPTETMAFDAVYVDPQLKLFPNAWSSAFLRHVNQTLKPQGVCCLPWRKTGAQPLPLGWPLDWTDRQFGTQERQFAVTGPRSWWRPWRRPAFGIACYGRSNQFAASHSVLDWWFHDHQSARREDVAVLTGQRSLAMSFVNVARFCCPGIRRQRIVLVTTYRLPMKQMQVRPPQTIVRQ